MGVYKLMGKLEELGVNYPISAIEETARLNEVLEAAKVAERFYRDRGELLEEAGKKKEAEKHFEYRIKALELMEEVKLEIKVVKEYGERLDRIIDEYEHDKKMSFGRYMDAKKELLLSYHNGQIRKQIEEREIIRTAIMTISFEE